MLVSLKDEDTPRPRLDILCCEYIRAALVTSFAKTCATQEGDRVYELSDNLVFQNEHGELL